MTGGSADTRERLVEMLLAHAGRHVSGEVLSADLDMTRAAVWKHMQALQAADWPIECVTRKGYRLAEGARLPYSAAGIRAELQRLEGAGGGEPGTPSPFGQTMSDLPPTRGIDWRITLLERTDSTNTYVKALASDGAPEGCAVFAETQTGGRGRMGRSWSSREGAGIWMSVLLRPDMPPDQVQSLTLAASVAVAEALQRYLAEVAGKAPTWQKDHMLSEMDDPTGYGIGIKWPNDILWQGRKLCGILTEMAAEPDRVSHVVVGIGLNVCHAADDFPPELRETAASLRQVLESPRLCPDAHACRIEPDRNRIAALLLHHLSETALLHRCGGLERILDRWRKSSATLGRTIRVMAPEGAWQARALDVGADGRLLVERTDGERKWLLSGEISIR